MQRCAESWEYYSARQAYAPRQQQGNNNKTTMTFEVSTQLARNMSEATSTISRSLPGEASLFFYSSLFGADPPCVSRTCFTSRDITVGDMYDYCVHSFCVDVLLFTMHVHFCFVFARCFLAAGNNATVGRANGQRALRDGDHQEPHAELF